MNLALLHVARLATVLAAFLGSASFLLGVSKEPFAGVDDKWRHYQSPHFEMFSRMGDEESRTVLHQVEVLRALFASTVKLESRAPAPVTIYYFKDDMDFRRYLQDEYRRNERYRAMYLPDPDRGVLLLAPLDDSRSGSQLALSSYVNHLFRMAGERGPLWFQAGFGHLFETLDVQTERVIFGKPQPGRVSLLQREKLMPLEALMGIEADDPLFTNDERAGLFYAQSWAFVHYLTLGQHKLPRDGIDRFFKFVRTRPTAGPEARRAAFEQCLGISLERMNKEIDSYVVSGRYTYSRIAKPELPPPSSYTRRNVTREEIRERLGEVAYRSRRDPAGRFALMDALSRNRSNVRALEALGAVAKETGERDEFMTRWGDAIEAGTENPAVICQWAQLQTSRWFRSTDFYFRLPEERTDQLRSLLKRSIKYAPLQSEAYEMLAWVESAAPTPDPANVNLVQSKFATLDDQHRTLLALALVRLRVGDRATAEDLLEKLEKSDADISVRQGVENVRAAMENRPPRRLVTDETNGRVTLQMNLRPRER